MPAEAAPVRTCVGCRRRAEKGELVRLVREDDGRLSIDRPRKAPGRGAYVHLAEGCLKRAVRGGSLERALRVSLPDAEVSRLVEEFQREMGERA